jgi:hypothetical protein
MDTEDSLPYSQNHMINSYLEPYEYYTLSHRIYQKSFLILSYLLRLGVRSGFS